MDGRSGLLQNVHLASPPLSTGAVHRAVYIPTKDLLSVSSVWCQNRKNVMKWWPNDELSSSRVSSAAQWCQREAETVTAIAGHQCYKSPAAATVLTMAMCNSTQFIAAFCICACVADDQDGSPRHRQQSMKWAQDPRDWTVNDWEKVARSDKSRFLVHYVHGRAHIRQLPTVAVAPGCTVGRTQAVGGCVIQWAMFSWDTLGPIIPIAQLLTAVRYMNINADQVQRYVNAYSDRQAG